MTTQSIREKLMDGLARADELTRTERAERIEWLSQHIANHAVVIGDMTVLDLKEEARLCFVYGHFIGALLVATSFIEHTLSEQLEGLATEQERRSFATMIKAARKYLALPSDLLDRIESLRVLRNPFTHRKSYDHPHSFSARFLAEKKHPEAILEADAQLAMAAMYELFSLTLRRA